MGNAVILASVRFKTEVSGRPVGETAHFRHSVDSVTGYPGRALFKTETLGAAGQAPIGLAPSAVPVHTRLGVTSGGVQVGYEGEISEDGVEVVLEPESSSANWQQVPGWVGIKPDGVTVGWPGFIMPGGGSPPVGEAVDVWNEVEIGGAPTLYPLLTGGSAVPPSTQPVGAGAQAVDIRDRLHRLAGKRIVYEKLGGVEKHHGEILSDVLQLLVGFSASDIAIDPQFGWSLTAHLLLGCREAVPFCRELAASTGHYLTVAPNGTIVVVHMAPVDEPPVAEIDFKHFELEELDAAITAVPPVKEAYLVKGRTPRPPAEGDGLTSVTERASQTRELYAMPVARWVQSGAGTISATVGAPASGFLPPVEMITGEVWVTKTYQEGCLVLERTVTWGMKVPEVARYRADGGGTPDGLPYTYNSFPGVPGNFFFDDVVVIDDGALMYAWPSPQLVPAQIEEKRYWRDELIQVEAIAGPPDPDVGRPLGWHGRELLVEQFVGRWDMGKAPLKVRGTATAPWDTAPVVPSQYLRGNGEPVPGTAEMLFVGPNPPFDPDTDSHWPAGLLGSDLGVASLAGLTWPFWSGGESEAGTAYDPAQPDFYFDSGDLAAALAVPKPGSSGGVYFENNDRIRAAQARLALVPSDPPVAIRVEPVLPAGFLSHKTEKQQGYVRAANTGPALWQYPDETVTTEPVPVGRVFETTVHVYKPRGNGTHSNLVTVKDAAGKLLPSTSTVEGGHSPIPEVCQPEVTALDTEPIEGWCINEGDAFAPGLEIKDFDFGVEDPTQAAEVACILQRLAAAPELVFVLPSTSPVLRSGSPLRLSATGANVDPAAYDTLRGRSDATLSNAWCHIVRHVTTRDDNGNPRPLTIVIAKLAIF